MTRAAGDFYRGIYRSSLREMMKAVVEEECFARLNRTRFAILVFMAGGFFLQLKNTIRVADETRFSRCGALGGTLVEPFCKPSALI